MDIAHERDSPPEGFTLRPATHEDIPALSALIDAFDTSFNHTVMTWEVEDFENDWRDLDMRRDTWVFTAPDISLAAYATLSDDGYGQLTADGYVHPNWRGHGLGGLILRLAEARAREKIASAPEGARVTLSNNVLVEDESVRSLLESSGYALARVFWRMRIELAEAPATPVWPEGVHVRAFETGRDEHAVYDVVEKAFGDHWGHTPVTFDEWWQRGDANSFDPSLWFLAETEEGEIVAAGLGRMRQEQGWIRDVATLRTWRKRGLARALLLQLFGAFWERGQPIVGLGVDAQSLTGAAHLYESVGMWPETRVATYEKELRPGAKIAVDALAE